MPVGCIQKSFLYRYNGFALAEYESNKGTTVKAKCMTGVLSLAAVIPEWSTFHNLSNVCLSLGQLKPSQLRPI